MIRQFFGIISKHDDDIFQTSQIRNGAREVRELKYHIIIKWIVLFLAFRNN